MLARPSRRPLAQLTGLYVAFGGAWSVGRGLDAFDLHLSRRTGLVLGLLIEILLTVVLLLILVRWEKQPVRSLGKLLPASRDLWWVAFYFGASLTIGPPAAVTLAVFWMIRPFRDRPPNEMKMRTVVWLVAGLAAVIVVLLLTSQLSDVRVEDGGQVETFIRRLSTVEVLALGWTAAVVEEIAYRGYAITRLYALGAPLWLATLISYVVFVASHIPGRSLGHVLTVTAIGSLTFPALYLQRQNLGANIVLHGSFNSMAAFR